MVLKTNEMNLRSIAKVRSHILESFHAAFARLYLDIFQQTVVYRAL